MYTPRLVTRTCQSVASSTIRPLDLVAGLGVERDEGGVLDQQRPALDQGRNADERRSFSVPEELPALERGRQSSQATITCPGCKTGASGAEFSCCAQPERLVRRRRVIPKRSAQTHAARKPSYHGRPISSSKVSIHESRTLKPASVANMPSVGRVTAEALGEEQARSLSTARVELFSRCGAKPTLTRCWRRSRS